MDTHCTGSGNIYIYFENNRIKLEDFNILNVHSLNYEEHNYIRDPSIKNDIQNLSKNQLKEKLKNYKYRFFYLKEIAISNINIGTNSKNLKQYFINEFWDLKYNFQLLTEEEKDKIILIYKKSKKLKESDIIDIKDIINLDNQCKKIAIFMQNKQYKNKKFKWITFKYAY